jgi:acyl-CoA thioester hydrolase
MLEGFSHVERILVVLRDLDPFGHVNNAVYLTYLETARLNWFARATGRRLIAEMPLIVAEITITYRSPAFFGEVLLVGTRVAEVRKSSFLLDSRIEEEGSGRLVATARAVMVHYDYAAGRAAPMPADLRGALLG